MAVLSLWIYSSFSLIVLLYLLSRISWIAFYFCSTLPFRSAILLPRLWTSQLNFCFCLFLWRTSFDFSATIFYTVDIRFCLLSFTASTFPYYSFSCLFSFRRRLCCAASSRDSSYIFSWFRKNLRYRVWLKRDAFLTSYREVETVGSWSWSWRYACQDSLLFDYTFLFLK